MSTNKITLASGTDVVLLFNSAAGIHNLRYIWDLALQHGMRGQWDDDEQAECAIEAEEYLNANICEGCAIQWNDGDCWIVRDGYDFENGCDFPNDETLPPTKEDFETYPEEYDDLLKRVKGSKEFDLDLWDLYESGVSFWDTGIGEIEISFEKGNVWTISARLNDLQGYCGTFDHDADGFTSAVLSAINSLCTDIEVAFVNEPRNETEVLKIPEWALPYLINGDFDRLAIEELQMCKDIESRYEIIGCPENDAEAYFSHSNDVGGLACNVYDCPCIHSRKPS